MQVELSQHALTRMTERGISWDEGLHTLANPLRTVSAENERVESQGWIDR